MNSQRVEFNSVFSVECRGDTAIVAPRGDANVFRYHDVHSESNRLEELLDEPELVNLLIDFSKVKTVGSIMLGVLIKLARKVGQSGGQAAFCNASSDMLDLLRSMKLDSIWTDYDSSQEALAAFQT